MARNININLEGKDNVSPALKNASARLVELRSEIDKLRAKGEINLTVADTRNLTKLTSEANRLERALSGVGSTGVKGARSLNTEFSGLDKTLSGLGLGGLTKFASVAGLAAAAVQVGKFTVQAAQMGAQSLDTKESFDSMLASIGGAPNLLSELKESAGGTITQLRLMQLTNTALAGSSAELGRAFASAIPTLIEGARAANKLNPALGDTEFLFNSLVTGIKRGSAMLIDNTGITLKLGEANEAYAASIGKSVNELTEEEKKLALLNATMEGVARLTEQAGGNLDTMTAKQQALKTSTEELKTALGELVAKPYTIIIEAVTSGINQLTSILSGGASPLERDIDQAANRIADAEIKRKQALEALANLTPDAYNADLIDAYERELFDANEELRKATVDMLLLKAAADQAAGSLSAAASNAAGVGTAFQQQYFKVGAPSDFLINRYEGITGAQSAEQEEYGRAMALLRTLQTRKDAEKRTNAEIAEDAGRRYLAAMQQAAAQVSSFVQGKLGEAVSNAGSLFDTGDQGGIFAPGANGPFEDLYRAADVAKLGGASPWAEKLGLTQDAARQIWNDFQDGLFTADVQKLIDIPKLDAALAAEFGKTKAGDAFIEALAGRLNVSAGALSGMLSAGGSIPAAQAPVTAPAVTQQVQSQVTVNINAGAVQVTTNEPATIASKLVAEVFKAFQAAEARISIPPPPTVAGAY